MSHRSVLAPFLTKTYHLVDDPATDDVISWNDDGTTFVVWKIADFAKDLLPNSFKHNNFLSFVRYPYVEVCNIADVETSVISSLAACPCQSYVGSLDNPFVIITKRVACKKCGNYGWGGCGAHLVTLYASIDKGKHCMCRSWPGVVIPKSDKPSGSTTPAITTTTTTAGTE